MAYLVKRGKKYYLYYREYVIDENGNKIKKLIGKPLSVDKQISQEALKKYSLNEDIERLGLSKRNIPIDDFFNQYGVRFVI